MQELDVRILLDTLTRTNQILDIQQSTKKTKHKITYTYILKKIVYDLISPNIQFCYVLKNRIFDKIKET